MSKFCQKIKLFDVLSITVCNLLCQSKGLNNDTLYICFSKHKTLMNWWAIDDLSVKSNFYRGLKNTLIAMENGFEPL